MAKKELVVTLGLDATSYAQDVKRANQVNKELDNSFKSLSSTSDNFENSLKGLGAKQEYLGKKMKVASELTEVYAKRLNESKQGLEETIQKSEEYKSTIEKLNRIKEESGKLTKEQNNLLKESEQLYEKAQKRIVTYNTRISESKQGYEKTQTSLQQLTKEMTLTAEKERLLGRNNQLDKFRNEISQTDEKFDTLKNSIRGFDNSLEGAVETQKHYSTQMQNTENLMSALNGEMKNTQSELDGYKKRLRDVSEELKQYEQLLSEIDESDEMYTETSKIVSELKEDYTALNTIVEFHEKRMKELSQEYKQSEKSLTTFNNKLLDTKEKIEKMAQGFNFDKIDNKIKQLANGSIEKLQKELDELEQDFKEVTSEVKGYENSLSGLDYKIDYLVQSYVKLDKMLSQYETEMQKNSKTTKRYVDSLEFLEKQLEKNAKLGKQMLANGDGAGADKQLRIVNELKESYAKVNKEFEEHNKKVSQSEKNYKQVKLQLASVKGELNDTSKKAEKMAKSLKADKLERELSKTTRKLGELDSKCRLATSKLEGMDAVFGSVAVQSKHMSDKIELSEKALVQLTAKSKNTKKELEDLRKEHKQLGEELEKNRQKLSNMKSGDDGYKETKVEVIKLENAIKELDNEIDKHENNLSQLNNEHRNLQAEINETTRQQQTLENSIKATKLNEFGSAFQQLGGVLQSAGMAMMPVTAGITALGASAVATGSSFYQSMSQVQAISGATGSELQQLTAKARELGAETIWSAKDASDALTYMGMAGWDASQMLVGLPQVLSLASAGNVSLSKTSDIVTDGLTAMGLKAEDTQMYVDVMAMTMASSNTNVELMGETMKYAGAVAGTLGINMQDLSLAVGTMANAGIKGSMAGTALRGGLTRLITPTTQAEKVMKQYGIEVQKTEDGSMDLRATMEHLQDTVGSLDKSTQSMIAKTLFGQTAMNGWLTIINADKEVFDDLALSIDNSAGSAERMAETMTDNLWGDFQALKSAIGESLISIFDAIEPMLRKLTQTLTKVVTGFTKAFNGMSPTMQKLIVIIAGVTASFAPLLLIMGAFANSIGGIMTTAGMFKELLVKFNPIFTTLGGQMTRCGVAVGGLGLKFALLTGAVGAVAVGLGALWVHMQKDAIEGMDSITKGMSDKSKEMVEPFLETKAEIGTVMLEMKDSNVAVTEDMCTRMEENLGKMADNTENILKRSQKSAKNIISKNMTELTGASEKQVSTMKARIDEIYEKKINTVQEKEKKILEIQKKAQEEGRGLLVSERNEMDNLLQDIQKISIDAMSNLSTEVADLEKKMEENRDSINAESISNAVKSAKEKRDKVVEESKHEYDQLVNIQRTLKDDLTTEESNYLDEMVTLAKQKKDRLIKVADEEYASLISSARKLARDSVDEIDWATGETKSKWEVFKTSFSNGFKRVCMNLDGDMKTLGTTTQKWGKDFDLQMLKWKQLWATGDEKDRIGEEIAKLEKQKEQMLKLNDEINISIDQIKKLPSDVSGIAYEIESVLVNEMGISLADFVNDVDGHLTKAKGDFTTLPPEVLKALNEYDLILKQAGVVGGMEQFVKYTQGKISDVRSEFADLPENVRKRIETMEVYFKTSADEINNISFSEYVEALKTDTKLAEETLSKLPKGVQKALNEIPKDEWDYIFKHFTETAITETEKTEKEVKKNAKKTGKAITDSAKKTKKEVEKETKETGKSVEKTAKETNKNVEKETKSAKKSLEKASEENGKAVKDKFEGELKDLPTALKDELANAGVVVQEDGQIIVQNMEKSARDGVTNFIGELKNELPKLDSVTQEIGDRLGGIDNIRLGNVTKQLSEVNKWLGTVQKNGVVAYASLEILTRLPFGNTTKALSEINKWLMRTSNRSNDSSKAMRNLTNLPFGNTTKGLSEVNQWLMRTTNRSKDTTNALKGIVAVTYGKTTKGLSEVNRWLKDNVTVNANKSRDALKGLSAVTYGRVTKGLSEVNRWLKTLKETASSTRSALYSVAKANSSIPSTIAIEESMDLNQPAVANSPLARESWLEFGDITKYKTSGGYYNPSSMKTQSNTESNNKELVQALVKQNQLLIDLLTADRSINVGVQVDGRQIAKASARYINDEISAITRKRNRLGGII